MGDIKQWSFGFNELKYYLFKKKRCPICGVKMEKVTEEEYIGVQKFSGCITGPSEDDTYEVRIYYYCEKCDKRYSLEELAKGMNKYENFNKENNIK